MKSAPYSSNEFYKGIITKLTREYATQGSTKKRKKNRNDFFPKYLGTEIKKKRCKTILTDELKYLVKKIKTLACVASVSVGLSAGLKHFSFFERTKITAFAPIFMPPKSEKCLGRALRKRLLRRLKTPGTI